MITNLQNLKQGSIIFISSRNSFIAWLLSFFTNFKYSDIIVYLGDNKVLESCWFGLKSHYVSFQDYLNNNKIEGEVITLFTDPDDIKLFVNRVRKLKRVKSLTHFERLQKALFGLEIEVNTKQKKLSIQDFYKKLK